MEFRASFWPCYHDYVQQFVIPAVLLAGIQLFFKDLWTPSFTNKPSDLAAASRPNKIPLGTTLLNLYIPLRFSLFW